MSLVARQRLRKRVRLSVVYGGAPLPSPGVRVASPRQRATSELDDGGASAGSVLLEVAAGLEFAGEGMADDSLGELAGFDHRVEIDARVDAELLAEEDE